MLYVKYTCSMETVQQNGHLHFFLVNSPLIYILFSLNLRFWVKDLTTAEPCKFFHF